MGLIAKDDSLYTEMGHPVPEVCNGCSRPLPDPPGRFIYWAFVGKELTHGGQSIELPADPDGIESTLQTEQLAALLGGCSEEGPHIALCWHCALNIGRNLIEDGALLRWFEKQYPYQLPKEPTQ